MTTIPNETETVEEQPGNGPEHAEETVEAPEVTPDAPEAGDGNDATESDTPEEDGPSRGNREAAKYRKRLREAEAERDALREEVRTLKREAVRAEFKIPEQYESLVREDIEDLDDYREHLEAIADLIRRPGVVRVSGTAGDGSGGSGGPSWADALRGGGS